MYVWFDALTNYISGVDYPDGKTAKYWPADIHLIGKDIVWFHAIIWPCMLLSTNIPLPKTVLCHGFVNGPDGRKMSKSYGNVINPVEVLAKYSSDSLRFYIMSSATFGSDFNFSEDAMIRTNDYELAANLGNLVHRALSLTVKVFNSQVPLEDSEELYSIRELKTSVALEYDNFRIQSAIEIILTVLNITNKYLTDKAPWQISGEDATKQKAVILRSVLESLFICAHFCAPVIPNSMEKFFKAIGTPMTTLDKLNSWGNLKPGTQIYPMEQVLFERIQLSKFDQKQADTNSNQDTGRKDQVNN